MKETKSTDRKRLNLNSNTLRVLGATQEADEHQKRLSDVLLAGGPGVQRIVLRFPQPLKKPPVNPYGPISRELSNPKPKRSRLLST